MSRPFICDEHLGGDISAEPLRLEVDRSGQPPAKLCITCGDKVADLPNGGNRQEFRASRRPHLPHVAILALDSLRKIGARSPLAVGLKDARAVAIPVFMTGGAEFRAGVKWRGPGEVMGKSSSSPRAALDRPRLRKQGRWTHFQVGGLHGVAKVIGDTFSGYRQPEPIIAAVAGCGAVAIQTISSGPLSTLAYGTLQGRMKYRIFGCISVPGL